MDIIVSREKARMSMTGYLNQLIKHYGLDETAVEYILLGLLADIRQQKIAQIISEKEAEDGVQQSDV